MTPPNAPIRIPAADAALTRRQTLATLGGAAALLTIGARGPQRLPAGLFTLGVASGDPAPDGMVLWTRLAPQPLAGDGGMPPEPVVVRWEVAEDATFAHVVRSGQARALPALGHSVHVEVAGLRPARRYWYRFVAGGEVSPVGRTATSPAPGARTDRLRACFASCQKYEAGFYAAYPHMVAEDPDLILFLGDYIYEGAPAEGGVRRHLNPEPVDLAGYRVRYATYKRDPLLQAAHAAAPWVITWDDHEVANDYAGLLDQDNGAPAIFAPRRAAAYQAFYEHQPLRYANRARGEALRLYRTIDWGDLAQFQVVDDRQYRGPRACQPPGLIEAHKRYQSLVAPCADLGDRRRTMLGGPQERWLMHQLGSSRACWNVLAQQTLLRQQSRIDAKQPDLGPLFSADTWSGYPAARDRVFRRWAEAGTSNPLAIGGDIHAFAAADIQHPDRPEGPPIASEFVGGSITSLFHDASFKTQAAANGLAFAENEAHGYGRLDIGRDATEITFRAVADSLQPQSPIADLARFMVPAGRPGLQRA